MLDALADAVSRHSGGLDRGGTPVPHLTLVALDDLIAPVPLLYEPMVCFIVEGSKRTVAGDLSWVVGRGQMFLNSIVLPVTATFERVPYRSVVLHIDGGALATLLVELDEGTPADSPAPQGGQIVAPMDPEITDAVLRWVRLLDTPGDIRALAPRVEGEILYRLLRSPLGPLLRQCMPADSAASRVRAVAAWIAAHYAEPVSVEDLAARAHMSTATLHRHFKATTGMSPMRFQKHLRLLEARRRLLAGGTTAASTAQAVGYRSATQFNREYRGVYGLPPAQDAARLRAQAGAANR
jgi:AraC-like DNA-binding protein